jgi:hypothetical protein
MRFVRHALFLAVAPALCSCAPYVGSCTWVVPEANAALETIEARKPISGECDCINCDAPGRFLLERESYTIEFWNGDRWYSHLHVRARSKDGAILVLSSESPEFLRMAPHMPPAATHGYEYFMRINKDDADKPAAMLNITVADAEGRVLGSESVRLRVETRSDLQFESI